MDDELKTEEIINSLELAVGENVERIKLLENILFNRDMEIDHLKEKIAEIEKKVKILPNKTTRSRKQFKINLFFKGTLSRFKSFSLDIVYAFELLKREGLKSFLYRTIWYLRGSRLIEDIQTKKKSKYVIKDE